MSDNVAIALLGAIPAIIAAMGAVAATIVGAMNHAQGAASQAKITEVHQSVNGQSEKLLALTAKSSFAEGKKEGEGGT